MFGVRETTDTDIGQSVKANLPVVNASAYFRACLEDNTAEKARAAAELGGQIKAACHSAGMFYLVGHNIDAALLDEVLTRTADFFATSQSAKDAISIKNSLHARGYGLLKNYRDWREQIHLGPEAKLPQGLSSAVSSAPYWQLWGENQWPESAEFKHTMLNYFDAVESLSRIMLTVLASAMEMPADFFTSRMKDRPYLLLKAMSYLPQEISTPDTQVQSGVTAHCDWSWLTFLIQDQVGGLEAQDAAGVWHRVPALDGAIVVNTGELLEIETGGYLRASAHRVINARIDRQRFSVPVFVNPALDALVIPGTPSSAIEANSESDDHIHKVIKPGTSLSNFVFGDSEFERKIKGQWCFAAECTARAV